MAHGLMALAHVIRGAEMSLGRPGATLASPCQISSPYLFRCPYLIRSDRIGRQECCFSPPGLASRSSRLAGGWWRERAPPCGAPSAARSVCEGRPSLLLQSRARARGSPPPSLLIINYKLYLLIDRSPPPSAPRRGALRHRCRALGGARAASIPRRLARRLLARLRRRALGV